MSGRDGRARAASFIDAMLLILMPPRDRYTLPEVLWIPAGNVVGYFYNTLLMMRLSSQGKGKGAGKESGNGKGKSIEPNGDTS